jgi:phosphoribosyl-ATP pyrophosphohydrolase/phosphoribosyl-AMP cyclohydrolase
MRPVASITLGELDELDFEAGLLPAIVQHADTRAVLMLGYMNREALVATLTRHRVVFYSRSKQRLWEKGETSGHYLKVAEVATDCDQDALLVRAWPQGPVCHTGSASCFGDLAPLKDEGVAFLSKLEGIIGERMAMRPGGSYTAKLASGGWQRIAQKVGEEAIEVALAATAGSDAEVVEEASDLLYHLLVLLKARGLRLDSVVDNLKDRHEKQSP